MYLLLIAGSISALLGVLLIIIGILQCRKRISHEDGFISAEAEVTHIAHRKSYQSVGWIPITAKEYSPILRYITDGGEWVQSALPYTLAISPEYRDYKRALENGSPLVIRYDPAKPESCYYGSKRAFRVREFIYKFIVAAPLLLIGYALIWSHFNI